MVDLLSVIGIDTFWVAIGAIGAVIALVLTYKQLRASRIIAAADFLLRLEKTFNSENMAGKRKRILKIYKQNPADFRKMDALRDVFDFFEELGLLLRKGIIPQDLVWSDYCAWTLYYFTTFKGYIDWARQADSDSTLYCEFEYLFTKMRDFEKKKLKKKIEITPQQIADFIDEEIELLST